MITTKSGIRRLTARRLKMYGNIIARLISRYSKVQFKWLLNGTEQSFGGEKGFVKIGISIDIQSTIV